MQRMENYMSESAALFLGGFMLCGWPLIWAAGGYLIGKYGVPVVLQWRGFREELDEDE